MKLYEYLGKAFILLFFIFSIKMAFKLTVHYGVLNEFIYVLLSIVGWTTCNYLYSKKKAKSYSKKKSTLNNKS